MPRGSLENHLFRSKYSWTKSWPLNNVEKKNNYDAGGSYIQPLSWKLRMKIALGAAKGLAFLHGDATKVIYRDFKASNVLLDSVSGIPLFSYPSNLDITIHSSLIYLFFIAELQCKAFWLWISKRWSNRWQKSCVDKSHGNLWICSTWVSCNGYVSCTFGYLLSKLENWESCSCDLVS